MGDKGFQPGLKNITLEQYAESNWVENNYMTRMLTSKSGGALQRSDIDLAKEILRRKCLVGIFDDDRLNDSLQRFEKFFGWNLYSDAVSCQKRNLELGASNYEYPHLPPETFAYTLLLRQNKFDMELFGYALQVF